MGRLKAMEPRLRPLPMLLAAPVMMDERSRSRHRDDTQPWRKWYKTARWQKLRWSVLERDRFTCRFCKRAEGVTKLLVCDHITPHQGDEVAFWAGPFQCLCKACHDSRKKKEEGAGLW